MTLPRETEKLTKLFKELNSCTEKQQNYLLTVASQLKERKKDVDVQVVASQLESEKFSQPQIRANFALFNQAENFLS